MYLSAVWHVSVSHSGHVFFFSFRCSEIWKFWFLCIPDCCGEYILCINSCIILFCRESLNVNPASCCLFYMSVPCFFFLCKISETYSGFLPSLKVLTRGCEGCQLLKTYLIFSVSCGACTNMPLFKNSSELCIKQTCSCVALRARVKWDDVVVGSFIFTYIYGTLFCQNCWYLACSDWQLLVCGSCIECKNSTFRFSLVLNIQKALETAFA